jgi:hypothetical protein
LELTAGNGLFDQGSQPRILDAPAVALGKIDEIGAPLLRDERTARCTRGCPSRRATGVGA